MVDSVDWSEKHAHRLSNPELRCRNQCGFYGNPMYHGYCSKCYKLLIRDAPQKFDEEEEDEEKKREVAGPGRRKKPSGSGEAASSGLGFGKFTMKKSLFNAAKGKGRGRLFASPLKIRGGTTAPIPPQKEERHIDPFNEFMKTLKKPAAEDIVQHLKTFRKQIADRSVVTIDEQSQAVQDFYLSTAARLETHPLFKNMSEDQQDEMMDGIEKHLMTNIFNKVFSPASCDDEVQDVLLRRKMRLLHWLTPSHLGEVCLQVENQMVQEVYARAQQELWNMESKKAPQDKLNCISRSCRELLEALRVSLGRPASADDFVPSLIFLIVHTTPSHLHSNINYITRFSSPNRLMTGEAGYYFTNVLGAVSFIENVSAEGLEMTQDEFNTNMGYTDGKTESDVLIEESDIDDDFGHIQVMKSCCQAMKEVSDRMQMMIVEANEFANQMDSFKTGVRDQVTSILSHPPPKSLYSRNTSPGQTRHSGVANVSPKI